MIYLTEAILYIAACVVSCVHGHYYTSNYCYSRRNGNYAIGKCENVYINCIDGQIEAKRCDGQSVFVESGDSCEHAVHMHCPNQHFCRRDSYESGKREIGKCITEYLGCTNGNVFVSKCLGQEAFIGGICRKLEVTDRPACYDPPEGYVAVPFEDLCPSGGSYKVPIATGCGGYYIQCSNHVVVDYKQCNQGYVLDYEAGLCRRHPGCTASDHGELHPHDYENPYNKIVEGVKFCRYGNDGAFRRDGCSREVTFCQNGNQHSMFCPYGEVYDYHSRRCQKSHSIAECNTDGANNNNHHGGYNENENLNRMLKYYCREYRSEKLHPLGTCSMWFVDCQAQKLLMCQNQLVFDTNYKTCVQKIYSATCPEGKGNPNKGPGHLDRCHQSEDRMVKMASPCDWTALLCNYGIWTHLQCPNDQYVFDKDKLVCIPREYMPECQGWGPQANTYPPSTCQNRPDGSMFPHSVCWRYYVCVHHEPVEMDCPDGTGFSQGMNQGVGGCDHLRNIPGCHRP